MLIRRLWLTDFRSYESLEVEFAPGLTALVGANGQGKTNLLEAVGYLATLGSFRGAPAEALIRLGQERAVVRGAGERDGRELLMETELSRTGRNRAQLNRQPLRRARDLLGAVRVTVFAPDDLTLVKGGPAERRRYLDDILVALHPRNQELQGQVDRILRQRNALLKQSGGRLTADIEATLAVWDDKFTAAGEALAAARDDLVTRLRPALGQAYDQVASISAEVTIDYDAPWRADGLRAALEQARRDELRRGVSMVGPHRDDLTLGIGGLPGRTHASQGEQRSLALALRLAAHQVVTEESGTAPILLLDDVFSELDPDRSDALLAHLPTGQTLLSTAGGLPAGAEPERVLQIDQSRVRTVVG